MSIHFIYDCETLSTNFSKAAIINCSYFMFDWNRFLTLPYEYDELLDRIVTKHLDYKFQIDTQKLEKDEKTVEFWKNQSSEIRAQFNTSPRINPESLIYDIQDYVGKTKIFRTWSRQNLLQIIAEREGLIKELNKVLFSNNHRDIKTFIDTQFNFDIEDTNFCPVDSKEKWDKMYKKYMSNHDVAADILRLQTIVRALDGK